MYFQLPGLRLHRFRERKKESAHSASIKQEMYAD